jgi:hypothetical protein
LSDVNKFSPFRVGSLPKALSRRLGTCDRLGGPVARRMKKIDYDGYRFPPAIIQQAVWLHFLIHFELPRC